MRIFLHPFLMITRAISPLLLYGEGFIEVIALWLYLLTFEHMRIRVVVLVCIGRSIKSTCKFKNSFFSWFLF